MSNFLVTHNSEYKTPAKSTAVEDGDTFVFDDENYLAFVEENKIVLVPVSTIQNDVLTRLRDQYTNNIPF